MTIQDILSKAQVAFLSEGQHHHCRSGWIQVDCPFCGARTERYHMGFNLKNRYFHCWKCGSHPVAKVLKSLGIPGEDIHSFFISSETLFEEKEEKRRPSQVVVPDGVGPLLPAHHRYLEGRGMVPEMIEKIWGIKGIGIASRLSWRIFIPIHYRGKLVSWTARAIGERVSQRYLSASDSEEVIPHKHLIYGREFVFGTVIVVEGPIDAWAVGMGAGALFGTAFTSSQIRELANIPRRIICFDSETTAQQRAVVLADQLSVFPGMTLNVCLDAKDPGSASRKEIRLLRKTAGL